MNTTNRLTYTLNTQQPHGLTQMSFLLPDDHCETDELLRELRSANYRTRYNIIDRRRLLMNNTCTEGTFIRPAELHFEATGYGMQMTDAYSVQEGHFVPYNNNPHDICAFHLRREACTGRRGETTMRYLFGECGFGETTDSENDELLTVVPPFCVREYLFARNAGMMNTLRALQPDPRTVKPAAFIL